MNNTPRPAPQGTVRIEAKSLELALVKAAGSLGVTQDEVEYKVHKEETSKGLFSFFKSSVVEIEAWIKPVQKASAQSGNSPRESRGGGRPSRDAAPAERRERRERPDRAEMEQRRARERDRDDDDESLGAPSEPLSPEKVQALTDELKDFCAGIVGRIAGEPVEVKSSVSEGRLVLDIQNEYFAQQISKNSKLAEAMEHILRKKPRHLRQELPFRIFVDVSGVRRQREDELVQMAFDLSAKVHDNKRPIVLNYKSSYDRKIIHMALDKDERVYTKSIGSGPNRKLMILPSRDGQGSAIQHPVSD